MKKLFSMILAIAMVLSLSTFVMAADQTTTITVTNVQENTKLALYQILAYTYDAVNSNITNVSFVGTPDEQAAYKAAFVSAILKADSSTTITGTSTVVEIMKFVTDYLTADTAFAVDLAEKLEEAIVGDFSTIDPTPLTNENLTYIEATKSYAFVGIPMGYYLILDTTKNFDNTGEGGDGTYYKSVVMTNPTDIDGTTVTLKSDANYEKIKKEVLSGQVDKGVKKGDVVQFKVTATVPSAGKEKYDYIITDTMDPGLELVGTPVVTIAGGSHTLDDTNYNNANNIMTFKFDQDNVTPGDKIIIEYSAKVTQVANFDNIINTVTDSKTDDKITLRTYGIDVLKTDDDTVNPKTLAGVKFVLYIEDEAKAKTYLTFTERNAAGEAITAESDDETVAYYDYLGTAATDAGATTLVTDADGKIAIRGLDMNKYYLKETETIKGYNLLTIDELVDIDGKLVDGDQKPVGIYGVNVINTTGIELPGTGGMGTAMFTILGTIIMAGAAFVLVINRKRIFNV